MSKLLINASRDRYRDIDRQIATLKARTTDALFRAYTPALSATGVAPVLGSNAATPVGSWSRVGDIVTVVNISVFFGSTGVTIGTGTYHISAPVPAHADHYTLGPIGRAYIIDTGVQGYPVDVEVDATGFHMMQSNWQVVTQASPFAMGNLDGFRLGTLVYRAAV